MLKQRWSIPRVCVCLEVTWFGCQENRGNCYFFLVTSNYAECHGTSALPMSWLDLVCVAFGLSLDACAVCLAAGASGMAEGTRAVFRLAFHFGLFQCLMPILGWLLGVRVEPFIAHYDHWVAFGLLVWVGTRMIITSLHGSPDQFRKDPSRGMTLVLLSIATSIDALAVGLSLAMLRIDIWYPSVVIGLITGSLSVLGVLLGRRLGLAFGRHMGVAGGAILTLIGLRILLVHQAF